MYVFRFHHNTVLSRFYSKNYSLACFSSILQPAKNGGGKNAFTIRMQDSSFYTMAAESEAEMHDWIQTIKTVISSDNISQRSTRTDGACPVSFSTLFIFHDFTFGSLTLH